jgi:hypothetical protein
MGLGSGIRNTDILCYRWSLFRLSASTHPSAKLTQPNGYLSLSLSFFSLVAGRGFAFMSRGEGGVNAILGTEIKTWTSLLFFFCGTGCSTYFSVE